MKFDVAIIQNAVTTTWNGGSTGPGDDNWSDGANWVGGAAPASPNVLAFDGSTRLNPINDFPANTQFNGIKFNNTAGAFTLSGANVNLAGNVVNNSSNLQTVNVNLALQQSAALSAASGNLTIGGNIWPGRSVSLPPPDRNVLTLSGREQPYTGATAVTVAARCASAERARWATARTIPRASRSPIWRPSIWPAFRRRPASR